MADVKIPFNLKLLFVLLVLLVIVAMLGFHFIEGWTYFDGFYMVLTTITSIGYGEIHPLSHAGRLFNSFIIITGVGLVLLLVGGASRTLLEFELQSVFGRRRMDREISRLSGPLHHLRGWSRGPKRGARTGAASRCRSWWSIPTRRSCSGMRPKAGSRCVGDATQAPVLQQLRIEHARGLVAATTTDAINIYIILTARSLNPNIKIIARAAEEDAEKHLLTAGADSVVSPYRFAGYRIAQTFMRPNVVDFFDTAMNQKRPLEIEEIKVEQGQRVLPDKTLEGSRIRQELGVIVLAIKGEHTAMRFNPPPDEVIHAGDHLIAMGDPDGLRQLEESASERA